MGKSDLAIFTIFFKIINKPFFTHWGVRMGKTNY